MKAFERRMAVSNLEVRDDDNGLTLTGYASTFDQPYDMGWYTETVDPGAFKRTLGSKPDVRLLVNHDGLPLARTTSGTLTLDTDKRGLMVSAHLDPADPDVARLAPKMRREDLNEMSFGFRTISDVWEDDMTKRSLRELDLHNGDVSVVSYPANPNTSASLRSMLSANVDAIASALRCLETRAATADEFAAVMTRASAYFAGDPTTDPILTGQSVTTNHIVINTATQTPESDDDEAARVALIALELRKRRLLVA